MLYLKIVLTVTVLFGSQSFIFGQSNVWKGIVPLKSTRADVEKILGKPIPVSTSRHVGRYKTEDGRVSVIYSTGPCHVKPSNGWDVPELTVVRVSFHPDSTPKITDLKLDEKKFDKYPDPGALYTIIYTNEADGVSMTVDTLSGAVAFFSYFPESKNAHLKCKKAVSVRRNRRQSAGKIISETCR